MDRAELIAQAQAKHAREQLIAEAKAKHAAESGGSQDQVKDEMPEWLSTSDRLIAKNFAQSPEKQLEFLKQTYPMKEFKLQDGEVIARDPKDTSWQRLDPGFHPFSNPIGTFKDSLADIGDIGYDVASGIGQSAATAAGAIGGAFAGGVGALPGAMVASGASSAGLEALRQKLGQYFGIPQEVNGGDVLTAGAAGTISPLLFGAGKTTTGIVSNLAKKAGATDALLNVAENGGRGLAERSWDGAKNTIFPYIGEKASGISRGSIKNLPSNMDIVDSLEKGGVTDYVNNAMNKVNSTTATMKSETGKAIQSAMDEANKTANMEPVRNIYLKRIEELQNKQTFNNADQDEINALKGILDKYFSHNGTPNFTEMSASDAFELQKRMKALAKFGKDPSSAKTLEEKEAMLLGNNAYHAANSALNEATDGVSGKTKDAYKRWVDIEDAYGNSFDDPQKTFNTLTSLDKPNRVILKERLAQLANAGELDLSKEAQVLQNFKDFANPNKSQDFIQSNKNYLRPTIGAGVGGAIGGGLGYWAGANSGAGQGGAGLGATGGIALGAALTSPQALRAIIRANMSAGKGLSSLLAPTSGAAPLINPVMTNVLETSPWLQFDK